MLTILIILAVIYIVLKTANMRARFAEEDAKRERAEAEAEAAAEEAAKDDQLRADAVDVEPEVIGEEAEDAAEITSEQP